MNVIVDLLQATSENVTDAATHNERLCQLLDQSVIKTMTNWGWAITEDLMALAERRTLARCRHLCADWCRESPPPTL